MYLFVETTLCGFFLLLHFFELCQGLFGLCHALVLTHFEMISDPPTASVSLATARDFAVKGTKDLLGLLLL